MRSHDDRRSLSPLAVFLRLERPVSFFLFYAIVFGLLFAVTIPPFEYADERYHAYKAWQVSQGRFFYDQLTGYIPKELIEVGISFESRTQANVKINYREIVDLLRNGKQADPHDVENARSNAFVYHPLLYAFSASSMRIAEELGLPMLWGMYFGRVANLAIWICIVGFGIAILPQLGKEVAFLALLPMSLAQGASLSADAVNNAFAFFQYCLVFSLLLRDKLSYKYLFLLSIDTILLASCKLVLYALPFSLVFYCRKQFPSVLTFWGYFLGTTILAVLCFLPSLDNPLPITPTLIDPPTFGSVFDPIYKPVIMLVMTVKTYFAGWIKSYYAAFGWSNTPLPMPFYFLYLLATMLMFAFMCVTTKKTMWEIRLSALLIFGLMASATIFALYFIWPSSESYIISGVQGRYFIPMIPILLIACTKTPTDFLRLPRLLERYRSIFSVYFLHIITACGLMASIVVICSQYYAG